MKQNNYTPKSRNANIIFTFVIAMLWFMQTPCLAKVDP